jgi:hypothetical protein
MTRVRAVVGWVCLGAAVVGGCATEETDVTEAAPALVAAAPIVQRLDEATQSIVFDPGVTAGWVDLHLRTNGARDTNVRMHQRTDGRFVAGPFALRAGDVLACSFTFLARGVGNDTATYTHVVPADFEPRALRPEVRVADAAAPGAYALRLVSLAKVTWADAHYTLNGAAPVNVRLRDLGGGVLGHPLALAPGDRLEYRMTYAVDGFFLETGTYVYYPTVAPASATTPWIDGFPRTEPGNPTPVPAGCSAAGDGFECAPYAFSQVTTTGGYRFAGDADVVPFDITGIGPFGTYYIRTLEVAFAYAGATPRTGDGVVRLPASAAQPGAVPLDAEDRDRGKYVSPTASLRAGYLMGGEGLSIALVDVNGVHGQALDVATYRGTYCRYGCSLKVPVAALAAGTDVDLTQIRYLELRTESGASVEPWLSLSQLAFDESPF